MSDTSNEPVNPQRWYIVAAVMLSTVMEILDTTIVNVSLPHMMGSLSADRDEISWVLTSYIVAASVLMPLTGFLVARLGSRRLLLINIFGFMIASALCGLSTNLIEMVFFRLLQGVFGASLVPLSQFILRDSFSAAEQPKAMAIWSIGIMAAPILGPSLGGIITDTLNWRWVFYINIPICIVNLFLVFAFIKNSALKKDSIDWYGMSLLIISISALQLFLDRGQADAWFDSDFICGLALTFLVTAILFFWHSTHAAKPIINLALFKDRSFAFGTLMIAFFAASMLGSTALLPQMLESLYGYTSQLSGLAMAPRGISSAIAMAISARLLAKGVNTRAIIATGLGVGGVTTWIMSNMSLDSSFQFIFWLGFIQGLGIGLFFMPLSAIVYANLPKTALAEATGLFSFGRNLGSAIGISLLTTYLGRDTQVNWHILGSHIQATNPRLTHWLQTQNLNINDPHTINQLAQQVSTQANLLAYLHTYQLAALLLFAAMIMTAALKPTARGAKLTLAAEH